MPSAYTKALLGVRGVRWGGALWGHAGPTTAEPQCLARLRVHPTIWGCLASAWNSSSQQQRAGAGHRASEWGHQGGRVEEVVVWAGGGGGEQQLVPRITPQHQTGFMGTLGFWKLGHHAHGEERSLQE